MIIFELGEIEQVWQEETTKYWFYIKVVEGDQVVDDDEVALCDCNGQLSLIGSDGYPVEECNDYLGLLPQLRTRYDLIVREGVGLTFSKVNL